jgi:hypothetical protein
MLRPLPPAPSMTGAIRGSRQADDIRAAAPFTVACAAARSRRSVASSVNPSSTVPQYVPGSVQRRCESPTGWNAHSVGQRRGRLLPERYPAGSGRVCHHAVQGYQPSQLGPKTSPCLSASAVNRAIVSAAVTRRARGGGPAVCGGAVHRRGHAPFSTSPTCHGTG